MAGDAAIVILFLNANYYQVEMEKQHHNISLHATHCHIICYINHIIIKKKSTSTLPYKVCSSLLPLKSYHIRYYDIGVLKSFPFSSV